MSSTSRAIEDHTPGWSAVDQPGNHPSTSTRTCALGTDERIEMPPPRPRGITTMFATVWPAPKFRLEVDGGGVSSGKTVRWPDAEGEVTVTLSTTAPVSVRGTGPRPDTSTSSWGPFGEPPPIGPVPLLVLGG